MTLFGAIGFATPWLLLGLLALPLLWLILRAVPPAPLRRIFPGVILLLGLKEREQETQRTPWWLLLLRCLAVGALILGFAGPVLNPEAASTEDGPLLIVTDGTWADARDWPIRQSRMTEALAEAARSARPVAVVSLTDLPVGGLQFDAASDMASRLPEIVPQSWLPDSAELATFTTGLNGSFDTLYLSSGLDFDGKAQLLAALKDRGGLRVFETATPIFALRSPAFSETGISVPVLRLGDTTAASVTVLARGSDPNGVESDLAQAEAKFAAGEVVGDAKFDLPPELRNRITRFDVLGQQQSGAVALADDALRRRQVALVSNSAESEGLEILSPLLYLREALRPSSDLIEGPLGDMLAANPDAILLADVATLNDSETQSLTDWVSKGGLLVRFAGPRLAASDLSRTEEDPLMPVRLRLGGRAIGGAMSWGEPRKLRPFEPNSPFHGLVVPDDVEVNAQVLAQPDPDLASRTIATLADGTPLVTRKVVGSGQVILFHITANAEWSSLPISGLFVQMLERLAVTSRTARPSLEELKGLFFTPKVHLDAFGKLVDAGQSAGIAGEELVTATASRATPPGLYAGRTRSLAINTIAATQTLSPARFPQGTLIEGPGAPTEQPLKALLLAAALALLALDVVATLALGGRLSRGWRSGPAVTTALVLLALMPNLRPATAQEAISDADQKAINATAALHLAYVITGDDELDAISAAGLEGLSQVLWYRTAIEPAEPMGVDIERDELTFFPFLYWPVVPGGRQPSDAAYAKLNRFMQNGGMILFDTQDDLSGDTAMALLARGLDVPPLEPIPADHVLTRSFYLLQEFPGRVPTPQVWVEAAPPDAALAEGMPFRNLNDGVTPVIIGGGDWARAWAVDFDGNWRFPVGSGNAGERQREMAQRFGVNVLMHVLTGNYKSDQVHVPALLERLGQ